MILDAKENTNWTHPDHSVDPRVKKGLEWNANALQFYVNNFGMSTAGNASVGAQGRLAFRQQVSDSRMYAQGRQSVRQYMPMLGHTKEQIDQNKSHMAIDWRIPQIWPKFRDIMLSKLNGVEYKIKAALVDPVSINARLQARHEMELKVMARPLLERWNQMAGANITGITESLPKTLEELDIAFELNYKEALALAAEKGIDMSLYANEWRELKKKLEEDSIDVDMVACRTYVDGNNALRIEYLDPQSLLLPTNGDRTFQFGPIGFVRRLTVAEVKRMDTRGEISSTEWDGLLVQSRTARGQDGQGFINQYITNRGWSADSETLDVVYMEYPSLDIYRGTKKKDKMGRDRYYDEDYNSKSYNTEHQVPMWYGCYWIYGTNSYFGWGPSKYQNRLNSQMNTPRSSIHVYSNTWNGINTNPLTERVKPFVNAFTVAWYKFQDEVNRARPSGFWIDVNALTNVVDGNGNVLHPKENVAAFLRSGVLIVNTVDEEGNTTRTPVQELPASLQSVEPYIQTMMINVQQIRDVTGLNEFADSSTPNKEISATATNYMVNASQNALYRAMDCVNYNYLQLCIGILSRLQEITKSGPIKGYIHAMGSASLEAIELTSDISFADIGLILENVVTPDEKMWLERQIEIALSQRQTNGVGGIELEDAIAIRQVRSVKMAERMLSIRRKMRKREDQQRADELSKNQAMYAADAGLKVEQMKQQTMQIELDVYRQKEDILTDELIKRYLWQYMWQNEIQDTKNEGAIAAKRAGMGLDPGYNGIPTPQLPAQPQQPIAQP